MAEHELKCWPEYYAAIDGGYKTCELRLNDRPYAVGDALLLREWEPVENGYTGRQLRVRVTHILNGGTWLAPGYIAMSIRLMGEDGRARVQEDFRVSYEGEKKRADTFQAAHRMAERQVAKLLVARSAADREVGVLTGERDELRRQVEELKEERRALCDILSADRTTIAGQTLADALQAIIVERDRTQTALRNARIYVDRMTVQVGPVAHDDLWQAKRVLQLIDAVLEAHDA